MAIKKINRDYRFLVKSLWVLFLLVLLGFASLMFSISMGWIGSLPSLEEIENPKSNLASQIISSDGELIGKFYKENRTHAEYNEISPYLVQALVATEDERFYEHSGIDPRGLARAVFYLGSKGGASTITQQLAKNLFSERPDNILERIFQKLQEWVIAIRIEKNFAKEEIITMYLNQVDFLYEAVGINSAANIYFGKQPKDLDILESALLVGMVKNPVLYNPYRTEASKKNAFTRRNTVLQQMIKNNYLAAEQYDSLKNQEIVLNFNRQGHDEGTAPYFREHVRQFMREWVKNNKKPDGSSYNIYTDGLKIYTTIDSRMQRYAEEAVAEHVSNLQRVFFAKEAGRKQAPFSRLSDADIEKLMEQAMRRSDRYRGLKANGVSADSIHKNFNTPIPMRVFSWQGEIDTLMSPMDSIRYYKHFYQTGLMAVEPQTGFIKAWVGGINFKHFKFDNVYQAKRQVGSTFKPFVYATAIKEKKYSPCFEVPDVRTCIEQGMFGLLKDWCPDNSDNKYGGLITLRDALAQSKNTVTTYLMKQIGPESVVRLCQDLGIQSEIPEQPSIALGTMDMSVYELLGAYTTFANKGVYSEPISITRIEDKNGVILEEFSPHTHEVMTEEYAYIMLNLLKGVTNSGTGVRLRSKGGSYMDNVVTGFPYGFDNPIAGKTGTTQNNSDGWFVGITPSLVAGVWAGCEDRSAHFRGTYYGQGATTALPTWGIFMRKCFNDNTLKLSKGDFEAPEEPISIPIYCNDLPNSNSETEEDEHPDWF